MSKDTRKTCVKQLRAVARELDVAQIRDDCGRSKVQEWFQTVVRAAGSKKTPDPKAKAEKAELAQETIDIPNGEKTSPRKKSKEAQNESLL